MSVRLGFRRPIRIGKRGRRGALWGSVRPGVRPSCWFYVPVPVDVAAASGSIGTAQRTCWDNQDPGRWMSCASGFPSPHPFRLTRAPWCALGLRPPRRPPSGRFYAPVPVDVAAASGSIGTVLFSSSSRPVLLGVPPLLSLLYRGWSPSLFARFALAVRLGFFLSSLLLAVELSPAGRLGLRINALFSRTRRGIKTEVRVGCPRPRAGGACLATPPGYKSTRETCGGPAFTGDGLSGASETRE